MQGARKYHRVKQIGFLPFGILGLLGESSLRGQSRET